MSKINFDQPSTGNVNSSADALAVANKGSGNAITGNANQGTGILGTSGGSDGVLGQSSSKAHAGVSAINDSGGFGLWARGTPAVVGTSANGEGVHGESQEVRIDEEGNYARLNDGVFGVGRNGVHGQSASPTDSGVWGENIGGGVGVAGSSNKGTGVQGNSEEREGVHGESNAATWAAVAAINTGGGPGLWASGVPAAHFEGDVTVTGQDLAEDFAIVGAEHIGAGTVVVIESDDTLRVSKQPYDKRVAGVVSGGGHFKPGIILGRQKPEDNSMPVALMGRVYCQVDAQYSSVEVGDLLTTSATPGHAMRAEDRSRAFGAVIGKALGSLEAGRGMIPILVALQ